MSHGTLRPRGRLTVPARVGAVAVALGTIAAFRVSAAFSASAAITETAPAAVTTPLGVPITSGGSSTTWTLTLPVNSHCTGDSATGKFHVFSYITEADPSTLTFDAGTGPSSGFSLIDTNGNTYIAVNTAINSGNIPQPPNFNFSLFSIDGSGGNANAIPAGTYNVGIACATSTGSLDQFWNVQETFAAVSASVDPNGETWTVLAATAPTTTTSTSTTTSTTVAGGGGSTTTTPTTVVGGGGSTTTSTTVAGTAAATTVATLAATGSTVTRQSDAGVFLISLGLAAVVGTRRRWRRS